MNASASFNSCRLMKLCQIFQLGIFLGGVNVCTWGHLVEQNHNALNVLLPIPGTDTPGHSRAPQTSQTSQTSHPHRTASLVGSPLSAVHGISLLNPNFFQNLSFITLLDQLTGTYFQPAPNNQHLGEI